VLGLAIGKQAERVTGDRRVVPGPGHRVGQRAVALDQFLSPRQVTVVLIQILQTAAPKGAFLLGAPAKGQDHRQGNLALAEVIADGLAQFRLFGGIVQRVVDQLEGNSQIGAEGLQRVFDWMTSR